MLHVAGGDLCIMAIAPEQICPARPFDGAAGILVEHESFVVLPLKDLTDAVELGCRARHGPGRAPLGGDLLREPHR